MARAPWIDYLSRPFVRDGDLAGLIDDGIVGVTSNPTIFQGAIADTDAYDDQLREVLATESDPKEVFLALARDDIRGACDLLAPVFDRGDGDPRRLGLARGRSQRWPHDAAGDRRGGAAAARDGRAPQPVREDPGHQEGLEAIEETIAAGIPVNVTLLFSLERHRAAAEAYLRGLRRLHDAGGDLTRVASVASFFVSRVDTEADRRLDEIGGHDELKGRWRSPTRSSPIRPTWSCSAAPIGTS